MVETSGIPPIPFPSFFWRQNARECKGRAEILPYSLGLVSIIIVELLRNDIPEELINQPLTVESLARLIIWLAKQIEMERERESFERYDYRL